MPKPPAITPRRLVRVLRKLGFFHVHSKGSHMVFANTDGRKTVVAMHGKDIPLGTLHGIIGDLGMTVEEFIKLLNL